MIAVKQTGWIGDIYYNNIAYAPAKKCGKEKFKEFVEKELEDKITLLTDIQEGYYRIKKAEKYSIEEEEYGEYFYTPCNKGRGATLYYFAGFEFKEEEN